MPEPSSTEPPRLSAVVVHWRSEEPLAELVEHWPRDPRVELVVVDNSDTLGELPAPVRVVRPGRNLGFGGGVNRGVEETSAPWILILNPDARPRAGALDALLDACEDFPGAAGIVPALEGLDGVSQCRWQLQPLPSPATLLAQTLFLGGRRGPASEPARGTAVEQPAAAALALRRDVLEELGGFDESFHPAWFEDVDLAFRLRRSGHRLLYEPRARFVHAQGASVPSLGYGPFLWIYYRNLGRYLRRHHGAGWEIASRATVVLGMVLRLKLLLFRRPSRAASRAQAAAALADVVSGAWSGWRRPHLYVDRFGGWRSENAGRGYTPRRIPRERKEEDSVVRSRSGVPLPEESSPTVAVCIVTYDSAADLSGCLEAVAAQDHRPLELVTVDCGSRDQSVAVARAWATAGVGKKVVTLDRNLGFAGGMNRAFAETDAPFLLTLNADARPEPDYVRRLLARMGEGVGAVTGRLVRPAAGGERRLDACGMVLTRTWRHLDRGSGEIDRGQWHETEEVFGATGAASLFSRRALDDVAVDGEVFDPAFHSFREDAELAFRLQERGWRVIYEPRAVAEHRRRVVPSRRRELPAAVNYHSFKNRYLLRAYHQTPKNLLRTLVPALWRDLLAFGWVLVAERSSLAAYGWLWRHRREILSRRRRIQERRTEAEEAVERWFRHRSLPLPSR